MYKCWVYPSLGIMCGKGRLYPREEGLGVSQNGRAVCNCIPGWEGLGVSYRRFIRALTLIQ